MHQGVSHIIHDVAIQRHAACAVAAASPLQKLLQAPLLRTSRAPPHMPAAGQGPAM